VGQLLKRVASDLNVSVAEHRSPPRAGHGATAHETSKCEYAVASRRGAQIRFEQGPALVALVETRPEELVVEGLY
jgi:hypothetical protein